MAKQFGLLARFRDTPDLFHAAEKVRDAGYRKWDTYAPLPIHGLPAAQGLPRSRCRFSPDRWLLRLLDWITHGVVYESV